MLVRPFAFAAPLIAVACLVGGCGAGADMSDAGAAGSTASARQASGGETFTCPERSGSFTTKQVIGNLLSVPVMLRASEYDCSDWSGVSTPGRAFTDQVIQPGEKRTFTLEVRNNVTRNWTMEIVDPSDGALLGRTRMQITETGNRPWITVPGSRSEDRPVGVSAGPNVCDILPLERRWSPPTPWGRLDKRAVWVMARGGTVAIASRCIVLQ